MRVYLSGKTNGMSEAEMLEFYAPYIRKLEDQGIDQVVLGSSLDYKNWQMSQRLGILEGCQALILVPGWEKSVECCREFDHAFKAMIQIRRIDQSDAFCLQYPDRVLEFENDFFMDS